MAHCVHGVSGEKKGGFYSASGGDERGVDKVANSNAYMGQFII